MLTEGTQIKELPVKEEKDRIWLTFCFIKRGKEEKIDQYKCQNDDNYCSIYKYFKLIEEDEAFKACFDDYIPNDDTPESLLEYMRGCSNKIFTFILY